MSWNHSSSAGLLAAVLLLVATSGVAGAMDATPTSVPDEAEVGQEVTVEVEVYNLYDRNDRMQFGGMTELENAEWTVDYVQDGEVDTTRNEAGSEFDPIELDQEDPNAPDELRVTVTGEVPAPDQYSYEEGQSFTALELLGHDGSSQFDVGTWSVDQYTSESREARTAIEDAQSTIDSADGDVEDAEATLQDAVAAYDDGDFASAVSLAEDAQSQAQPDDGGSSDDGSTDDGSADDGSTDGGSADDGTDGTTDDGTTDEGSSGADDSAEANGSDDDGGIGFVTVLLYVFGFAAVVAVVGGALYVNQQRKGPNRDPLG